MNIRFLQQQWTDEEFQRCIEHMIEHLKAECPQASEEAIRHAVIRDWLALSEPIGRA